MKIFINPLENKSQKVAMYFVVWIVYLLLTLLPGIILVILSLGTFNYFGITASILSYLQEKAYG
jgi:hypothetical protein